MKSSMKNCSFCNSKPIMERLRGGRYIYGIYCSECIKYVAYGNTKKEAIEKWNTVFRKQEEI